MNVEFAKITRSHMIEWLNEACVAHAQNDLAPLQSLSQTIYMVSGGVTDDALSPALTVSQCCCLGAAMSSDPNASPLETLYQITDFVERGKGEMLSAIELQLLDRMLAIVAAK